MKQVITKVTAIFDRVIDILAVVAGVTLIYISLFVSADITARSLLHRTIPHVIAITEILLVFIAFLVAAWLLKGEGHVKMDFVLDRFKSEHQCLINLIASILSAITCLVITWYGAEVTLDFFQRGIGLTGTLEIPKAPLLVIIPVGFFLLFIQFLRRGYGYLEEWRALRNKKQKS